MWRHRSWDVPQSPPGDADTRYLPSRAPPPSSCSRGAEALRLGADSPCFGVWGKGFPCFPGASPAIPSSLPGAGATQPPQRGCQRAGRALSTPSLRVRGVSGGFAWAAGFLLQPVGARRCRPPSPPALLGTVGPRGGRRDLPRGGYWSAPVALLGWQLGPCLGSPGFQPGSAPLGKRGGGKQPSRPARVFHAKEGCPSLLPGGVSVSSPKAAAAPPAMWSRPAPALRAHRPPSRGSPWETGRSGAGGWPGLGI